MGKFNLCFYCFPKKGAIEDFQRVSKLIEGSAPEIRVRVLSTASLVTPFKSAVAALRPSLSIEMDPVRLTGLIRGERLFHQRLGKIKQMTLLQAAGLPVPEWTVIEPETRLDPAQWGPYVVVKPSRGSRGAYVRISRTGRVRFVPQEQYALGHPGRRAPMIAQRFVHTGPWPTAFRVLTFLGRPLAAIRYEGRDDLAPLASSHGFDVAAGGSIVASARGCTISLAHDREVLDLARRAHAVFPTIPSLGVDVLSERETGKLYVIEVNPSGNSWMLSGEASESVQKRFGIDFHRQFGAIGVIAEASADAARRLAR